MRTRRRRKNHFRARVRSLSSPFCSNSVSTCAPRISNSDHARAAGMSEGSSHGMVLRMPLPTGAHLCTWSALGLRAYKPVRANRRGFNSSAVATCSRSAPSRQLLWSPIGHQCRKARTGKRFFSPPLINYQRVLYRNALKTAADAALERRRSMIAPRPIRQI